MRSRESSIVSEEEKEASQNSCAFPSSSLPRIPPLLRDHWPIILKYHSLRNSRHTLRLQASVNRRGFPCPKCARVFRTTGGMSRHYRLECVDMPRFKCPHCEMRSKYTQAVYRHIRAKHLFRRDRHIIEHKERYFCPRCNSSFSKKSNMLTHYRHECGKAPRFQCPYCGKKDRKSSNTYRHIRMHHKGSSIQAYRLY
ncbi:Longitudinals lacking protein, isoforms N/O/W/X/Y [Acromyrmex echinatior]|uniref:Longitudinals lacking protein, isoforms N/O/W/X/Y n=1 Tax=Acromyrmex echinatior TaxID=103372 RepID=F4WH52_ACREC|nr:Longitudinals lacking protein, isoforms N/O/W/X/Y [Acromyrmex echinatior]